MNNKLNIKLLIENDRAFTEKYVSKQKLQVIINKTVEEFEIDTLGRELKREDGTPLLDWSITIEDAGIQEGECLRFFPKAPKPDRDKGFA